MFIPRMNMHLRRSMITATTTVRKSTGLTRMILKLTTTTMIMGMTMLIPMATAMTMMRIPTRIMIMIFIPTTMVRKITNVLKSVLLPICMNTAMIFSMHTIIPTILNMQVLSIRFLVTP